MGWMTGWRGGFDQRGFALCALGGPGKGAAVVWWCSNPSLDLNSASLGDSGCPTAERTIYERKKAKRKTQRKVNAVVLTSSSSSSLPVSIHLFITSITVSLVDASRPGSFGRVACFDPSHNAHHGAAHAPVKPRLSTSCCSLLIVPTQSPNPNSIRPLPSRLPLLVAPKLKTRPVQTHN